MKQRILLERLATHKRWPYILPLLLITVLLPLASCSPGHLGSNIIAFVRDGQLWTIDPNGANAFAIVAQDTPVIGYAWAPGHQFLTFRALDPDFAKTPAAKQLSAHPITGQIGDAPGTGNTVSVDGGSPITFAFSNPNVLYSNATWNTTGSRLLYRQSGKTPPTSPDNVRWWVSQNDQPGGIGIKTLPGSYSIPSFSYNSSDALAIGNSTQGLFTTTLAGTDQRTLQQEPLPGHPLAATLERILWQPAHQNASFLYAQPIAMTQPGQQAQVQLLQRTPAGQVTPLATCACRQFAWSPDGKYVLYSDTTTYTILRLSDHSSFTLQKVAGSVPYWSPDSRFLLLDGPHTLTLVEPANKRSTTLLSSSTDRGEPTSGTLPAGNALLQTVPNNIWAADSRHFLFLTHERLNWQEQPLKAGKGLYTVTIDEQGKVQGAPVLVDKGNDTQAGWTYLDPNTSFLY